MALSFTINKFPKNGSLLSETGLPWGCVAQPFVSLSRVREAQPEQEATTSSSSTSPRASSPSSSSAPPDDRQRTRGRVPEGRVLARDIARCESCFAYINCYARFVRGSWWCPLCHNSNALPPRYATGRVRSLPEMQNGLLEFEVSENNSGMTQPVFIALVDLTGGPVALESIKTGLAAAIQDRLGIYDLRSPIPHIKHIAIPESGDCSLGLEELVPLTNSLVELSAFSEQITVAIEGLKSLQNSLIQSTPRRGFGTAIRSLVDFIDIFEESLRSVRLMAFLCGIPSYGDGKLEENSDLTPQTTFYQEQAKRAAEAGVCIDLFVVTNAHVGLASLKFLSILTGGNMQVYEEPEGATLPQDLYRQFTRPQAANGLFRLRTSRELKTANAYGHFYPDPKHDNLYHMQGCDEYKCFAFDIDFSSAGAFASAKQPPTIQMAFAYTYIPSVDDEDHRQVIRRRLRLQTVQIDVVKEQLQFYRSADQSTILCLLTHKLIRASLDEGVQEGQLLLKDWLAILLTYYNEFVTMKRTEAHTVLQLDLFFDKAPNLAKISRLVFALLKSPFLDPTINVDTVIYAQCLYSGLEPSLLRRALYPALSSWLSADALSHQDLPLSKSTIFTAAACRLFLADGYHSICVYYVPRAEGENEAGLLPPPKGSLLRKTIDALRQERHVAPRVVMAKAGTPQEALFEKMLVEEGSDGTSYAHFTTAITTDMTNLMRKPPQHK